ncbi:ABC transporter substrate-binding protein [Clostridiales bacterium F-3ap]|uniref:ABC transporter substrate-binding protein n=2 Tax=Anaerotalea alkaliphila TaxID=2662126 RepID=A0A7X5KLQ3_9FIRM|nr:ABC transporter substrate-binding protein [Anaerotalea alkaliphila]NDL66934.1 ABC transporter substrate-binding protein [Anaerotalea alkaliphila]
MQESLYTVTEKYPEAIPLLVAIGLENMQDPQKRKVLGKNITMEAALRLKKVNPGTFMGNLQEAIRQNRDQADMVQPEPDVKVAGVLPCPVKVPLMESFTGFWEKNREQLGFTLEHDLKSASMGLDWMVEDLAQATSEEALADLFISAGFDIFFDEKLMGKFKAQGVFEDLTGLERYNSDFSNSRLELRDPDRQYAVLGVVPAIFLVNREELGDRPMPKGWGDLLGEAFEGAVSLPIGDFDLFNAILLNIYKNFGEEGVERLGRSLLRSMHPSEMVKSHQKRSKRPAVTIMPYFFTHMVKEGGPMVAVWPEEGAIASPIFLLAKKSKREMLKPLVEFFASKEVGEILAHNGRFPSVHPEVDNRVPEGNTYLWVGWDFIRQNDLGPLLKHCEALFHAHTGS